MTNNYESFIFAIASQFIKQKLRKQDKSFFTPEDLIALTVTYIRNDQSLQDRLIEAIPSESEDYMQRLGYFDSFTEGSNTAFLMLIGRDITFANNAIIEALANALKINIAINIYSYPLKISPNLNSKRTITISMTSDFLFFSDDDLNFPQIPLIERDLLVNILNRDNAVIAPSKYLKLIERNPTFTRDVLKSSDLTLNSIEKLIATEVSALKELDANAQASQNFFHFQLSQAFQPPAQVPGYDRVNVVGDGNCLFNVIALQLREAGVVDQEGIEYNHLRLREIAINYIDNHREDFIPLLETVINDYFPAENTLPENYEARLLLYQNILNGNIEAYLANMRQNHVWADYPIIQALVNAINLRLRIHQRNGHIEEITPNNAPLEETIPTEPLEVHALLENDHYSLLIPSTEAAQHSSTPIDTSPTHPVISEVDLTSTEAQTIATALVNELLIGVMSGLSNFHSH